MRVGATVELHNPATNTTIKGKVLAVIAANVKPTVEQIAQWMKPAPGSPKSTVWEKAQEQAKLAQPFARVVVRTSDGKEPLVPMRHQRNGRWHGFVAL